MMHLYNIAALLISDAGINWPITAAMLAVIIGGSSLIGALVSNMIVRPMIASMKDSILATLKEEYVTKETFNLVGDQAIKDHQRFDSEFSKVWSEISKRVIR